MDDSLLLALPLPFGPWMPAGIQPPLQPYLEIEKVLLNIMLLLVATDGRMSFWFKRLLYLPSCVSP